MEASIGVFDGPVCGRNQKMTDGRRGNVRIPLWTVSNTGRDPFGEPFSDTLSPSDIASLELAL
jgi:hypothetical protein